jgi:hypothetical protein
MKCEAVRHHLLASAKPARPPAAVGHHLAQCSDCRKWQQQLVRIERLVPELPVPRSKAKAELVRDVLHADAFGRGARVEVQWQRRERALRKVAITFAMAAGLLFFALIWYAWQRQRDSLVADTISPPKAAYGLNDVLVKIGYGGPLPAEPTRRMQWLADAAKHIQNVARDRAEHGNVDEVSAIARDFETVVRDGILEHAVHVPAEERGDLLARIADQMARAESEANRLANEHPQARKPLIDMAVVAHNSHLRLVQMAADTG